MINVRDLLGLVKEDGLYVEVDVTETDFQYVLTVSEAIKSCGGYPIKEIQSPVDSDTFLRIIV